MITQNSRQMKFRFYMGMIKDSNILSNANLILYYSKILESAEFYLFQEKTTFAMNFHLFQFSPSFFYLTHQLLFWTLIKIKIFFLFRFQFQSEIFSVANMLYKICILRQILLEWYYINFGFFDNKMKY